MESIMNNERTYQILTNLDCNLNCKYCYENKNRGMNDISSIKKFITLMLNNDINSGLINSTTQITIDFIGGEPFLYPKMLLEIMDFVVQKTQELKFDKHPLCTISTNATLFKNKNATEFIKKFSKYLHIGISVDGIKKCHDENRIFKNSGLGSYDVVMENVKYLFSILCKSHINVKATFNKKTLPYYKDSLIEIINLGIPNIMGNFIFEENYTMEESLSIMRQLIDVVDYIFENNLETKIKLNHLLFPNPNVNKMVYNLNYPDSIWNLNSNSNYCGSTKYMRCIGFDNKIYGCNRFLTMNKPNMEIGIMKDNKIEITNKKLMDEIINQYKMTPKICNECHLKHECPSCVAFPYEREKNMEISDVLRSRNMCNITKIHSIIKLYIKERLSNKYNGSLSKKENNFEISSKKYKLELIDKIKNKFENQLKNIYLETKELDNDSEKYIFLNDLYKKIQKERDLFINQIPNIITSIKNEEEENTKKEYICKLFESQLKQIEDKLNSCESSEERESFLNLRKNIEEEYDVFKKVHCS